MKRPSAVPPSLLRPALSEARLQDLFRRALAKAAIPGFALALGACSEAPPTAPIDAPPICDQEGWNNSLARLSPQRPADYVAYYMGQTVIGETGEPCKTATDRSACMRTIERLKEDEAARCGPGGCFHYLIVNRGDEVQSIKTQAELVTFLGRIDSTEKATLLSVFAGYNFDCSLPPKGGVRSVAGGFELMTQKMLSECPVQYASVLLFIAADGTITVKQETKLPATGTCVGRRPEGLHDDKASAGPQWTLATFLTDSAALEAASVPAFIELADNLTFLNAPQVLVDEARRSASDEIRHTTLAAKLAKKYQAPLREPKVDPRPAKDLFALACENAVEGCVRETFGALVAQYQATHATDPELRQTMSEIANDECRHAALAWQIAAWAEPQLEPAHRDVIALALKQARAQLRAELKTIHAPEVYSRAGWPNPEIARVLTDELHRALPIV